MDQFRPFGREAFKFLEGQTIEEVEKMVKGGCTDAADAVSDLYDERAQTDK